jgi:microsomal dipeptidase-like Zn-dependent dipeptidase
MASIADNLGLLSVYHRLGVRIIQLTYNHQTHGTSHIGLTN